QLALVPGHCSAGSHSPEEARQMVVVGSKASFGQTVLVPVQLSATSQTPATARHSVPACPAGCWQPLLVPSHSSLLQGFPSSVHAVPAGTLSSAGQAGPVPGQLSAASHSPATPRQRVVAGSKASGGQVSLDPSQVSATSHTSAVGRQTDVLFASAGRVGLAPVQLSAGSQTPAEAR